MLTDGAQVLTVDADQSLLRVEETRHQVDESALAGAARADERDGLPGGDTQRHFGQHRLGAVAETDAGEFEVATHAGQRTGVGGVRHFDLGPQDLLEAGETGRGHAQATGDVAEALDRSISEIEGHDEREQFRQREAVHRADGDRSGDTQGRGELDQRRQRFLVADQLTLDAQAFPAGLIETLRLTLLQSVGPDLAGRLEVLDRDAVEVGSRSEPLLGAALDA